MSATTVTLRIGAELSDAIDWRTGEFGAYENVSDYVRDLILNDAERVEREKSDWLKAHLQEAFAQPAESYVESSFEDILRRVHGPG